MKVFYFLLSTIFLFSYAHAQTGICALDAGSNQKVCYLDTQMSLGGSYYGDIDPNSIQWISPGAFFQISDPSDIQSTVTLTNPPTGTYQVILSAECIQADGSRVPISDAMTVTVMGPASTATITSSGTVFCHDATLTGSPYNTADETIRWHVISSAVGISVNINGGTVDLHYPNHFATPCPEITIEYIIDNGGCTSRDTATITFIGQDTDVRILDITKKECFGGKRIGIQNGQAAICVDTSQRLCEKCGTSYILDSINILTLSGTNIGCDGSFEYKLLNDTNFTQKPYFFPPSHSEIRTYQNIEFYQSGCYVFEYTVSSASNVCPEGRDTVEILVHMDTTKIFDESINNRYCDLLPEFGFGHYTKPNDTCYSDWIISVDRGVRPNIICTPITSDSSYCQIVNIDTITRRIIATQYYRMTGCDGLKRVCDYRQIILELAPEFISPDTTITSPCGPILNFNPWTGIETIGSSRGLSINTKVLSSPSGNSSTVPGAVYSGTTKLFDLEVEGEYEFGLFLAIGNINSDCDTVLCVDSIVITVLICDPEFPTLPVVLVECANETFQLIGSSPQHPCSQPLWRQLSGPPVSFVNGSTPNEVAPFVEFDQTGNVCIEYSYSIDPLCYLADTLCFELTDCDTACLTIDVLEVHCNDNMTSDPNDDFWSFDLLVTDNSGMGSYWGSTGDINEFGSYGVIKTIYTSGTILSNPSVTFTVFDAQNPSCSQTITVHAPPTCSHDCDMGVSQPFVECLVENGNIYYTVTLDVSVSMNDCFLVKRKNPDGSEVILGTYTGSQTITFGPYTPGEEFTIWVMLCDNIDCVIDFYVRSPNDCGYCLDYEISNIVCYDQGTSDPSDDFWSFDIMASGGPGTYWTAGSPVNQSSGYNLWKTIWAGTIQSQPTLDFTIVDDTDPNCFANVQVQAPTPCSQVCDIMVIPTISPCVDIDGVLMYYVTVDLQSSGEQCFSLKKKNIDGGEEDLGSFGTQDPIVLGPFPVEEGFTLWAMLCEFSNCVTDVFIAPPVCTENNSIILDISNLSEDVPFEVFPNPTSGQIFISCERKDVFNYVIHSIQGVQVQSGAIDTRKEAMVDINTLKTGVYTLILFNDVERSKVKKIQVIK